MEGTCAWGVGGSVAGARVRDRSARIDARVGRGRSRGARGSVARRAGGAVRAIAPRGGDGACRSDSGPSDVGTSSRDRSTHPPSMGRSRDPDGHTRVGTPLVRALDPSDLARRARVPVTPRQSLSVMVSRESSAGRGGQFDGCHLRRNGRVESSRTSDRTFIVQDPPLAGSLLRSKIAPDVNATCRITKLTWAASLLGQSGGTRSSRRDPGTSDATNFSPVGGETSHAEEPHGPNSRKGGGVCRVSRDLTPRNGSEEKGCFGPYPKDGSQLLGEYQPCLVF